MRADEHDDIGLRSVQLVSAAWGERPEGGERRSVERRGGRMKPVEDGARGGKLLSIGDGVTIVGAKQRA